MKLPLLLTGCLLLATSAAGENIAECAQRAAGNPSKMAQCLRNYANSIKALQPGLAQQITTCVAGAGSDVQRLQGCLGGGGPPGPQGQGQPHGAQGAGFNIGQCAGQAGNDASKIADCLRNYSNSIKGAKPAMAQELNKCISNSGNDAAKLKGCLGDPNAGQALPTSILSMAAVVAAAFMLAQ